ncbi:MAG TPA: hypothetical protein P5568_14590 [Acidobacteriota bacterium]|nr:hypothetical protein [Acidobacteriota bacterium]
MVSSETEPSNPTTIAPGTTARNPSGSSGRSWFAAVYALLRVPGKSRRRLCAGSGLLVVTAFVVAGGYMYRGLAVLPPPIQDSRGRLVSLPVQDVGGVERDLMVETRGRQKIFIYFSPTCSACNELRRTLKEIDRSFPVFWISVEADGQVGSPFSSSENRFYVDHKHTLMRLVPWPVVPVVLVVGGEGEIRRFIAGSPDHESLDRLLYEVGAAWEGGE